jgi:uncharacterized oligopeptide transporter (OPT) family protein
MSNINPLSNLSSTNTSDESLGQIATQVWDKNGTVTIIGVGAVLGLGIYALYKLMKW